MGLWQADLWTNSNEIAFRKVSGSIPGQRHKVRDVTGGLSLTKTRKRGSRCLSTARATQNKTKLISPANTDQFPKLHLRIKATL